MAERLNLEDPKWIDKELDRLVKENPNSIDPRDPDWINKELKRIREGKIINKFLKPTKRSSYINVQEPELFNDVDRRSNKAS